MPICSYLLIPAAGAADTVHQRLRAIPGCDVVRAENRDVLLLVTDTEGLDHEEGLRRRIEAMEGIEALLLAFGEIELGPRPSEAEG